MLKNEDKNYFNKISLNLIGCIYEYFTPKEMILLSSLNKKFMKALSCDFIYKNLVSKDILFLPEESSSFKSWLSYYKFLSSISSSIKTGKLNKKYSLNTYRGHKSIISNVVSIQYSDCPSSFIVSADDAGVVCVWNLEKDEDDDFYYKNYEIFNTNTNIDGVMYYPESSTLVIWDINNYFYIYKVDTLFNSAVMHKDRFSLLSKFNSNVEGRIQQIYIDFLNNLIYMSNQNVFNLPAVYCFNYITGNLFKKYSKIFTTNLTNVNNSSKIKINNNFLVYNNNIFLTNNIYYLKNNQAVNPNLYIFNIKYEHTSSSLKVNLTYIIDIFLNKKTNELVLVGYNNNFISILVYKDISAIKPELKYNLEIKEKINILDSNSIYITKKDEYNSKIICLFNTNKIINIDICKKEISNSIILKSPSEAQNLKINIIHIDIFRIIISYDNNHLAIYSSQTGDFWFYLIGGSLNVVPKSFKKHPAYTGFHIIVPTRYSIIAALGNLIREYKFVPNITK